VRKGRLQFLCAGKGSWVIDQVEDVCRIENALKCLDPILDRGVIEISIGKDEAGFHVRDYRIVTGHNTVDLSELSASEITRACNELG
jgi:hypothetical protein